MPDAQEYIKRPEWQTDVTISEKKAVKKVSGQSVCSCWCSGAPPVPSPAPFSAPAPTSAPASVSDHPAGKTQEKVPGEKAPAKDGKLDQDITAPAPTPPADAQYLAATLASIYFLNLLQLLPRHILLLL